MRKLRSPSISMPIPTPTVLLLLICSFITITAVASSSGDLKSSKGNPGPGPEQQTPLKPRLKVVSGLHWNTLPSPTFYESYAPLILQYKTPIFNKSDVNLINWFNCSDDDFYSCKTVFHLQGAMQNRHVDFESLVPGKDDQQVQDTIFSQETFFTDLTEQSSFCTRIQSHYPGSYVNRSDYEEYYLKKVKQCSTSTGSGFYFETGISDYNYNIRQPYAKMEANFYYKFHDLILKDDEVTVKNSTVIPIINDALLANSRTAVQGALLSALYAERNRWRFAFLSCQQGKLPANIVMEEKLRGILKQLEVNLTSTSTLTSTLNEKLSLSIPLSSLSKYYSLPLTDCTHTDDELVIRILVPLTSTLTSNPSKLSSRFTLRSVHPIPFIFQDKVCKLKHVQDGSVFLFDRENQLAYDYDVNRFCEGDGQSQGLCLVDLLSTGLYGQENACVSAIFSGKGFTQDIGNYCQFQCVQKGKNLNSNSGQGFLSVKKLSSSELSFAGSFPHGVSVKCQSQNQNYVGSVGAGTENETVIIPSKSKFGLELEGALEFEYICNQCSLVFGQRSLKLPLLNQNECQGKGEGKQRSDFSLTQTVPFLLLNEQKQTEISDLESTESHYPFTSDDDYNLKNIVDYERINSLTKKEITDKNNNDSDSVIKISAEKKSGPKNHYQDEADNENDVANIIASEFSQVKQGHDKGHSDSGHGWFFWTFLSLLSFSVIILLFSQYFMMKKLMEMQGKSFKDLPNILRSTPGQPFSYRRHGRPDPTFLIQDPDQEQLN